MRKKEAAIRTIRDYVLKDKVRAKRTELAGAYIKIGKIMVIEQTMPVLKDSSTSSSSSLVKHGRPSTSFTQRLYSFFVQKNGRRRTNGYLAVSPLFRGQHLP